MEPTAAQEDEERPTVVGWVGSVIILWVELHQKGHLRVHVDPLLSVWFKSNCSAHDNCREMVGHDAKIVLKVAKFD